MSLVIPFNSVDADSFYVSETAKVTVDGTFETLSGKITKINNAEQVLTGNMLVKYVTIDINNPGGLTASTSATAKVGDVACNSSAQLTYKSEGNITAKASGDVTSISVGEGNSVGKGGVVLTLNNSSLSQNIPSAELSVQEAQKTLDEKQEILDDCTVKAPIAGTIAEKPMPPEIRSARVRRAAHQAALQAVQPPEAHRAARPVRFCVPFMTSPI